MAVTFKCKNCGEIAVRTGKSAHKGQKFCCLSCAAKWRTSHVQQVHKTFTMDNRGTLPYDDVNVRITADLDLFPGYRPNVGSVYKAERYQGQGGSKLIGYVIAVNGHRVNIRRDECVEV